MPYGQDPVVGGYGAADTADVPDTAGPRRTPVEIPQADRSGLSAFWHSLLYGAADVGEEVKRFGAHLQQGQLEEPGSFPRMERLLDTRLAGPGAGRVQPPATLQDLARERQQLAIQQANDPAVLAHPHLAGAGNVIGNLGTSALITAPAMALRGRLAGPVAGGAGALTQPVTSTGNLPNPLDVPGSRPRMEQLLNQRLVGPRAPVQPAPTIPARLAASAATTPARPAAPPVSDDDDYWSAKGKQVFAAMLMTGGVMDAALGHFAPTGDPLRMQQAGVPMTAGMRIGWQNTEEQLKKFPILYNFIRRGEGRSLEGFQRATGNQALDPLHITLPQNIRPGHPLVNAVHDAISDRFDQVLPRISLSQNEWVSFLNSPGFQQATSSLTQDEARYVGEQLERNFENRFQNGILRGTEFKLGERQFRNTAFAREKSQPAVADAMTRSLSLLRDELANANPVYGQELRNINLSFAMYARLRVAANKAGANGQFSPWDLLQTIRNEDPSPGRDSFSRGQALLQPYAEAANNVLGKDMRPNPAYRPPSFQRLAHAVTAAGVTGAGIGAHQAGIHGAGIGGAIGVATGALPYARYGVMQAANLAGRASPAARTVASIASGRAAAAAEDFRQKTASRKRIQAELRDLSTQYNQAVRRGNNIEAGDVRQKYRAKIREFEGMR
jgi:hypothetical protein